MSKTQSYSGKNENLEANIDYIRKRFKAVDFLRPDCHPDLQPVPCLAYYGVAVTRDELYDYATRKGLQPDPWCESEVGRRLCMYRAATKLLSAKIEFPFELRMPLNPDFQWNIALYSNYAVDDEKLIPEDEEFVVTSILKEMNLPEDRFALWHYDYLDGKEEMRCQPWTPPSKELVQQLRERYKECEHEYICPEYDSHEDDYLF
ncbi:hypothetical protein BDY19DRAFT_1058006 [Irpex rosettiformis]|uniref:Uncharacterized protein n=1 Tax=Irpex rosettiformis TaxID=378272 RepID=A0ACB8U031_9APHY|nr:hypothetical protein BDY19DRAFT_1058006 [Irpex rosettiformis]